MLTLTTYPVIVLVVCHLHIGKTFRKWSALYSNIYNLFLFISHGGLMPSTTDGRFIVRLAEVMINVIDSCITADIVYSLLLGAKVRGCGHGVLIHRCTCSALGVLVLVSSFR